MFQKLSLENGCFPEISKIKCNIMFVNTDQEFQWLDWVTYLLSNSITCQGHFPGLAVLPLSIFLGEDSVKLLALVPHSVIG